MVSLITSTAPKFWEFFFIEKIPSNGIIFNLKLPSILTFS